MSCQHDTIVTFYGERPSGRSGNYMCEECGAFFHSPLPVAPEPNSPAPEKPISSMLTTIVLTAVQTGKAIGLTLAMQEVTKAIAPGTPAERIQPLLIARLEKLLQSVDSPEPETHAPKAG